MDGSFVDSALRWRHADVLLRTRLDGHDALVYVLIEHQNPDTAAVAAPFMPRLRFLLDDLRHVDERRLLARPLTSAARSTLLVLGAAPGSADVAKDLSRWLDTVRELLTHPDGSRFSAHC